MMKPSTKAKKLQVKIAYFMLSGRKPPKEIIISQEWGANKIWHLKGSEETLEPHCRTCKCWGGRGSTGKQVKSLCTSLVYDPTRYPYNYHAILKSENLKRYRPCKRCLSQLSKISNTED